MDKTTLKNNLLLPFLQHAAFDGWNMKALEAACWDIGEPPAIASLAFSGGMKELWEYYIAAITQQMEEVLASQDMETMKIRERITLMVRTHLSLQAEHKEALRHASSLFISPVKPVTSSCTLWGVVDRMWMLAGDTSTDYNHYTKRTLLMGVYVSTFFAWLSDHSEDGSESWAFLDRRIENVMQFGKMTGKVKALPDKLRSIPFVRLLFKQRSL